MNKLAGILIVCLYFFSCADKQQNDDTLKLSRLVQPLMKANIFRDSVYFNWGSSIIKGKDNKYHLFYSRWPRKNKFTAWLTHSEVAHAIAENPSGPYQYIETALKSDGGNAWDAITAHNPKIKYFDGKYYLYYISTNNGASNLSESELIETAKVGYTHENWPLLRNNQRTGVAVSESLSGPWVRSKAPIIEPSGPITTITVNPAVCQGKNGKYFMIIKGDKPNEKKFIRNQALATSNSPHGPFDIQPNPVIDNLDTEDASMWYDQKVNRFYAVFHAHKYIGLMTSLNGYNWEKAHDYEIITKQVPMTNDQFLTPDRLERPFVFVEDDEPKVLSLAVKKGNDAYSIFISLTPED